ncbi:IclR family transcriptional regulator [Halorubrum ezzemoulense]|uniref:IclR family transcriptional regulator n=1 Tax=Halorubrum ezzemoulense TaxID=337243 RepID=A0A256JEK3_HALEZ|nr:IclR family transcriptional regulator [Halorubrum ezzemoulense]OYR64873.1 IclR family transcriptional regulator [Halorubrum ezzemoulense]OYR67053.1 IclR family transcriptional regulator [Halorubrum ezzemoulense]OYR75901.1 IclR family transcriptional regulator [Halorubrum ezzemoulense]
MTDSVTNGVQAIKKTSRILTVLQEQGGGGVTEIAGELSYNKSTVHHHLTTLREEGLVIKRGDQYHLGIRLFELGAFTRRQRDIYSVGKPQVNSLAEKTGELANLMIEENGKGVYIQVSAGEDAVNLDTSTGTEQYLHTCAIGKSILSEMPSARVDEIIDQHGLPAETSNTVTDQATLKDELEEIRERGVAFDNEERAEAIRCVATPVTNKDGELLGGISISGPATRMRGDRFKTEIPELVQNAAEVIGLNASYSG